VIVEYFTTQSRISEPYVINAYSPNLQRHSSFLLQNLIYDQWHSKVVTAKQQCRLGKGLSWPSI